MYKFPTQYHTHLFPLYFYLLQVDLWAGATSFFALLVAERVLGCLLELTGYTMLQAFATEWAVSLHCLIVHKACHTPGIEGLLSSGYI